MKYTALAGAFFAAALIASPLFAFAKAGDPIPGLSIGLEGDPGSVVIAQAKTNSAGVAVFQNVKPGKYQLTVYVAGASGGVWKTENDSSRPTNGGVTHEDTWEAAFEINIPGQAKVVRTISKAGTHSRITAIAVDPRDVSKNRLLIPFTVAGNKVQTVTVTIFDRWGNL